jgi:transposase
LQYLAEQKVSAADRFVVDRLLAEWREHQRRLKEADQELAAFGQKAAVGEKEGRRVLETFPLVGPVTIDIVLSEVGDAKRFRSLKRAASFAGLAPGFRESAGRRKEGGITKEGPRLLRWAMIQLAWRLVGRTAYWGGIFVQLERRTGKKKAIVAVARRAFCVIVSMLRSGRGYRTPRGGVTAGFRRNGNGVQGEEGRRRPRQEAQTPRAAPAEAKPRKRPRASPRRPRRVAPLAHR